MKSEQQIQRIISPVPTINELLAQVSEHAFSRLVFVGLGNPDRGDDGAGLVLLEKLIQVPALQTARFIRAGRTPENYLGEILHWKPACLIFIDTAWWGGNPGEIIWVTPGQFSAPECSTHAYSLRLIELYLSKHFPMEVKYLGIQPFCTNYGAGISSVIQTSLHQFFNRMPK